MQNCSSEEIRENRKLKFPVRKSNKSRLIGKLHYYWCWLVVGVLIVVIAAPLLIFFRLIGRPEGFYPWASWGARLWLRLCGMRVRVEGRELLEKNQAYIFVANHRSFLDTAGLFAFTGRRIGLVAKNELLKIPVFGYGMGFVNIIAIDRTNAERARLSMDKARDVVGRGYSFGVFAEGTRALPGELLPFKKGAFHLALQTGAPVVPVVFKNTDALMGKRTGIARRGTIEIRLLEPIATENLSAERDLMDLLIKTREKIAEELEKAEAEETEKR